MVIDPLQYVGYPFISISYADIEENVINSWVYFTKKQ